jgi:hypothetical protein
MKRGGFWMTTVAAGVAVLVLMSAGRAGLKSHAALFLQGQMKIAAGDTETGLKLLAEASSRPQMGASLTNPLENASQPVKAAEPKKPCKKWAVSEPSAAADVKANQFPQISLKIKPAPEPTLASMTPVIPMPPMLQTPYAQDAMAYIPTAQREALRAHRTDLKRAQYIRERQIKKVLHELSYQFEMNSVPSAREIQIQVQKSLGTLAQ